MKAAILCGGQGTRIRDVSEALPKPMLPIGGMPMLWHIMKIYAHYGIKEFVLCLGYNGWKIKDFFLNYCAKTSDITVTLNKKDSVVYHNDYKNEDWKVTLVETGEDSQTGARIWYARPYLKDCAVFSVTYGDSVADINIKALLEFHKRSGFLGTIVGVHPLGRFGEIETKGDLVSEFNEKPNVGTGLINGGFIIFNREVLKRYFYDDEKLVMEVDVLPKMAQDGQLGVYKHKGFWQCVDTPREYNMLNEMWKNNNAPWKVWG